MGYYLLIVIYFTFCILHSAFTSLRYPVTLTHRYSFVPPIPVGSFLLACIESCRLMAQIQCFDKLTRDVINPDRHTRILSQLIWYPCIWVEWIRKVLHQRKLSRFSRRKCLEQMPSKDNKALYIYDNYVIVDYELIAAIYLICIAISAMIYLL